MPKVIYFLRGLPSEAQWEEARVLRAVFRDPDAVGREGDFVEDCEAVCGERIPEMYAHKPVVECSLSPQKTVVSAGFQNDGAKGGVPRRQKTKRKEGK